MAVESIDSLVLKELQVKKIIGPVEIVLAAGQEFIIKDKTGFEMLKINKSAKKRAQLWLNKKKVLG